MTLLIKMMVFFMMLGIHVLDDFHFQGILASLKQKTWWEENAPDKMYERDYIAALISHATEWAFFVTIVPLSLCMLLDPTKEYTFYSVMIVYILNVIVHAVVDDLKANRKKINLITDQLIHVAQIVITWIFIMF